MRGTRVRPCFDLCLIPPARAVLLLACLNYGVRTTSVLVASVSRFAPVQLHHIALAIVACIALFCSIRALFLQASIQISIALSARLLQLA